MPYVVLMGGAEGGREVVRVIAKGHLRGFPRMLCMCVYVNSVVYVSTTARLSTWYTWLSSVGRVVVRYMLSLCCFISAFLPQF